MQAAQAHVAAPRPVVVGQGVGPVGVGDVHLDHHEVGGIVQVEFFHVFVLEGGLVVGGEVGGQRRQAQRREQGILDGAPVRAFGLGKRRKDKLYAHWSRY